MGNKLPQPTITLLRRLRRVARRLDERAEALHATDPVGYAKARADANTLWQAAARIEELAGGLEEAARALGHNAEVET